MAKQKKGFWQKLSKLSPKQVFGLSLLIAGLLLGLYLLNQQTSLFSWAAAARCSSTKKTDKACRGKKVGQKLNRGGTCEATGKEDKQGRDICYWDKSKKSNQSGNQSGSQGGSKWCTNNKKTDKKCRGRKVGTKFGKKECVAVGRNKNGVSFCELEGSASSLKGICRQFYSGILCKYCAQFSTISACNSEGYRCAWYSCREQCSVSGVPLEKACP